MLYLIYLYIPGDVQFINVSAYRKNSVFDEFMCVSVMVKYHVLHFKVSVHKFLPQPFLHWILSQRHGAVKRGNTQMTE